MTPDFVRVTRVAAKGGKGGKQASHQPNIAPNTLRSRATVRILEVLSEGPVKGMHDAPISPLQSVFLDRTAAMDAAGNNAFNIKESYFREGLPSQDHVPGYPLAEAPFAVNVELHAGVHVIRSLQTPRSAVRVLVRVPALYIQTDQGDVTEAEVHYQVDLSVDGGPWYGVLSETIHGKTMTGYERAVRIELPYTTGTLQIRLSRPDPDPSDGIVNNIFWASYVEISDGQLAYDDTCVAALAIDAEDFPSPPSRGYLLDGLEVAIPSNYDPLTREYDGDWDGSFTPGWTDNPAWVLFALLTNERWGLGLYLDAAAVDKWGFYEAARYNDELVPDGLGGQQSRWTCNCVINTRQDAFSVLNAVASSMLALLFWANGTVFIVQDRKPVGPPSRLFSPADVEAGLFDYTGTDYRSRWSAAVVTWNDPGDEYSAAQELVQDQALVAQQGYRETQQTAFGCTRRGQAIRVGRWFIYTAQYETEIVSFRVGLENADVKPGEIVALADPSRAGARLAGRLQPDDGADTLTLDRAPDELATAPASWTIYVTVGSAADAITPTVYACAVVAVLAGNQVRVTGKRPDMVAGSNWMASSAAVTPRHWRVAAIADRGKGSYEIVASEFHEEKFTYVDEGVLIPPPSFSLFPTGPLLPPSDLTHSEYIYLDGSGVPQFGAVVSWQISPDPRVRNYMLELSGPGGDYRRFAQLITTSQDVPALRQGPWTAILQGFDNIGRRTTPLVYNFTPIGLSAKPLPPSAVYLTPQGDTLTIQWTPTGEVDVSFWWVKWSPVVDATASWGEATTSIARVPRQTTQITTPTRAGTYMVKAIDSIGQESDDWTSAILLDQITDRTSVADVVEQPDWLGDLGAHWLIAAPELHLPAPTAPEPVPPDVFPGERGLAFNQTPTRTDIYGFADALDLGIVCQVSMAAIVLGHGDYPGHEMATWIPLASAVPLQAGVSAEWDAHIECRVSQDAVAFEDWTPISSQQITGRVFEWRLVGSIYDLATTIRMMRAEALLEAPTRSERGDDIALDGTGHATITYRIGFLDTPSVQLTARQGLAPGGNIVITDSDAAHFTVEHQDATGAPVAGGSIDYIVQGVGGYA